MNDKAHPRLFENIVFINFSLKEGMYPNKKKSNVTNCKFIIVNIGYVTFCFEIKEYAPSHEF